MPIRHIISQSFGHMCLNIGELRLYIYRRFRYTHLYKSIPVASCIKRRFMHESRNYHQGSGCSPSRFILLIYCHDQFLLKVNSIKSLQIPYYKILLL